MEINQECLCGATGSPRPPDADERRQGAAEGKLLKMIEFRLNSGDETASWPWTRNPCGSAVCGLIPVRGPACSGGSLDPACAQTFGALGRKIFMKFFAHISTTKRVDMSPCFSYTCAVVQSPLGLVVKGKSSSPEQSETERGFGRAAEMGRQPRKAA